MNISHNSDEQAFVMALGNTQAVLQYSLLPASADRDSGVDFTRTYVPSEFRGQGYAEALVKHGLNWANQQGLKVQASCWYVRDFL
ncbi:MAG: GNAT family N-acetyltransferase [Porticoccus sp.]